MSIYSLPTLIGSISLLSIGIFVLKKNSRSPVNLSFFLFCLSIFGWLFFFAIAYSMKDISLAGKFGKAGCISSDFAGPCLYHFIVNFLNLPKEKKWVTLTYIFVFILFFLGISTNLMLLPLPRKYFFGYYPHAGPLHFLALLLHAGVGLRCLILLYRTMKTKYAELPTNYYNQMKLMFWALFLLIFPSMVDYMPKYGIKIYPFGWMAALIFCFTMGYAIVKHNLMDINIIIRKTLIYSILVGFITACFVATVVVTEKIFQGFTSYQSIIASAIIAFIIALGFNPLKDKIQHFIDKRFYHGTPEEIAQENEKLREEILKQDKMKAIAILAAGMAHEIKNPLATIKTFTDYLPERHDDKSFIQKFNQLVKPQIERINYSVQQLLDFAKPTPPDLQKVSIREIVDEILELLSADFLKKKIKISAQYENNKTNISADANQLKQIFLNLFLNAIDAMPQGGSLTIAIKQTNPDLEISIEDTGCGISKDTLKHIFDPFYTTKSTGTGLGLYVIREILDKHKAKIEVRSELDKGTNFIIKFPIIA